MDICVLTHFQAEAWKKTEKRPDCNYHIHIPAKQAYTATELEDAVWANDDTTSRAIVIYDCVRRYEWRAKRSAGFSVLQMVPIRK